MNAAVLHTIGRAPRFETFSDPVAQQSDEVIIDVRAAALKPVDKQMANGSHYAAFREFPVVCGVDGVGRLADGSRVFFARPRLPHGAMAEQTVAPRSQCFPLPDNIDDVTAAAVFNPGLSAWGALQWRAQLAAGERVLILGATGVTGKLAIQTAKLLGAGRVVAAGRNEEILSTLRALGADVTIPIGKSVPDLTEALVRAGGENGFDVIIDYLWGAPTEALLAAIGHSDFKAAPSRVRLVEVGESAGASVTLPASVLRSSRLEILGAGTGSAPTSPDMWVDAIRQMLENVASGKLRIETERVPLSEVESAWGREWHGRRPVLIP
jgi:NADPH:quinone reductase-like Zn-dependent oxidoreductase